MNVGVYGPDPRVELVRVGPAPADVRVRAVGVLVSAWLDALEPMELPAVVAALASRTQHALAPAPGRAGWLLDATEHGRFALWSEETDRAWKDDLRVLVRVLEVWARALLAPTDGLVVVRPGEPTAGRVPAEIDVLRQAHLALLTAMEAGDVPRLTWMADLLPPPAGTYRRGDSHVQVEGTVVRPADEPVLAALFGSLSPEDLLQVLRAARHARDLDLGGWELGFAGGLHTFASAGRETALLAEDALALLELAARVTLGPLAGAYGAPPWAGPLARVHTQVRGLLRETYAPG